MSVQRIHESPRVTKPYTEEQWQAIVALGHAVDARSRAHGDVRLTMGGEPTFVSDRRPRRRRVEHRRARPDQARLAADAAAPAAGRTSAPNGFVHFGQGKWYPGEQLPRWALGCYWRRDGEPAWRDPSLVRRRARGRRRDGPATPSASSARSPHELGVSDAHVQAGYEDVWYYLWRERRLPVNVDPFDARLDDEMERDRAAPRVHAGARRGRRLCAAAATRDERRRRAGGPGRGSCASERMYLLPGRLADGLPPAARLAALGRREDDHPRDPIAIRRRDPPLPAHDALPAPRGADGFSRAATDAVGSRGRRSRRTAQPADDPPARSSRRAGSSAPRSASSRATARCYVFMPPVGRARGLPRAGRRRRSHGRRARHCRVLLEGYPPPHDPRLAHFKVTPDPGVIEVNVQPGARAGTSWSSTRRRSTRRRAQSRLDDREVHARRPPHRHRRRQPHRARRRRRRPTARSCAGPICCAACVGYWHNHPSLSYLFSGLFIGPTSQAPRVDEARNDSLYELEIAFAQLPPARRTRRRGWSTALFRNLLVDVTGNTHRAEFCIDKLYSPRHGGRPARPASRCARSRCRRTRG